MDKRSAYVMLASLAGAGLHAGPAIEATPHEMTAIEQTETAVTDVGQAFDDASSADDVAQETETIDDQLTSEADVHPSPEANPEGDDPQKSLLDLEEEREEEEGKEAKEDLELGDGEEVASGNIIAPASPAREESTVTGEGSAVTAADDAERAQAAAEADQERAEGAARADDESRQQAAAEAEERPAAESEPADETWLEDDADVDDPDIG